MRKPLKSIPLQHQNSFRKRCWNVTQVPPVKCKSWAALIYLFSTLNCNYNAIMRDKFCILSRFDALSLQNLHFDHPSCMFSNWLHLPGFVCDLWTINSEILGSPFHQIYGSQKGRYRSTNMWQGVVYCFKNRLRKRNQWQTILQQWRSLSGLLITVGDNMHRCQWGGI